MRENEPIRHAVPPELAMLLLGDEAGATPLSLTGAEWVLRSQTFIDVPESSGDVATGVLVHQRDKIVIHAWGRIWAGVIFTGENGPEGWTHAPSEPKFPHPHASPYCLIGRLDDASEYFFVGPHFERVNRGSAARLVLRVNDDRIANGSGRFHCSVQIFEFRRL